MNRISYILLVAAVVMGGIVSVQQCRVVRLKKERDRHAVNSDALLSDMKQWRIDSATMATDVKMLRLTIDELERYRAEDAAELKRMGIKMRNLEAAAKHRIEVNAPLAAPVRDSVIIRDTVAVTVKSVSMITPHIQLRGIIENDSLTGSVRLPVTLRQSVWIEYKRRCLFWRKVKAVHQTITSDNPYAEIKYSEYITIQKR